MRIGIASVLIFIYFILPAWAEPLSLEAASRATTNVLNEWLKKKGSSLHTQVTLVEGNAAAVAAQLESLEMRRELESLDVNLLVESAQRKLRKRKKILQNYAPPVAGVAAGGYILKQEGVSQGDPSWLATEAEKARIRELEYRWPPSKVTFSPKNNYKAFVALESISEVATDSSGILVSTGNGSEGVPFVAEIGFRQTLIQSAVKSAIVADLDAALKEGRSLSQSPFFGHPLVDTPEGAVKFEDFVTEENRAAVLRMFKKDAIVDRKFLAYIEDLETKFDIALPGRRAFQLVHSCPSCERLAPKIQEILTEHYKIHAFQLRESKPLALVYDWNDSQVREALLWRNSGSARALKVGGSSLAAAALTFFVILMANRLLVDDPTAISATPDFLHPYDARGNVNPSEAFLTNLADAARRVASASNGSCGGEMNPCPVKYLIPEGLMKAAILARRK